MIQRPEWPGIATASLIALTVAIITWTGIVGPLWNAWWEATRPLNSRWDRKPTRRFCAWSDANASAGLFATAKRRERAHQFQTVVNDGCGEHSRHRRALGAPYYYGPDRHWTVTVRALRSLVVKFIGVGWPRAQ